MSSRKITTVSKEATRAAAQTGRDTAAVENLRREAEAATHGTIIAAESAWEKAKQRVVDGNPYSLEAGMAAVAAFLYEPGEQWDPELRRRVNGNTLNWPMEWVLNGIVWSACQKLHLFEDRLDQKRDEAKRLRRRSRLSDVDLSQLENLARQIEDLSLYVQNVREFCERSALIYLAITGKHFDPPARRVVAKPTERTLGSEADAHAQARLADLDARLGAHGVKAPKAKVQADTSVVLNHDGIDAATEVAGEADPKLVGTDRNS